MIIMGTHVFGLCLPGPPQPAFCMLSRDHLPLPPLTRDEMSIFYSWNILSFCIVAPPALSPESIQPCGRDGMVDITDLKSVGLRPWEFESPRPHHLLWHFLYNRLECFTSCVCMTTGVQQNEKQLWGELHALSCWYSILHHLSDSYKFSEACNVQPKQQLQGLGLRQLQKEERTYPCLYLAKWSNVR